MAILLALEAGLEATLDPHLEATLFPSPSSAARDGALDPFLDEACFSCLDGTLMAVSGLLEALLSCLEAAREGTLAASCRDGALELCNWQEGGLNASFTEILSSSTSA